MAIIHRQLLVATVQRKSIKIPLCNLAGPVLEQFRRKLCLTTIHKKKIVNVLLGFDEQVLSRQSINSTPTSPSINIPHTLPGDSTDCLSAWGGLPICGQVLSFVSRRRSLLPRSSALLNWEGKNDGNMSDMTHMTTSTLTTKHQHGRVNSSCPPGDRLFHSRRENISI